MSSQFTVTIYFDYLSPFSYFLCLTILKNKNQFPNTEWRWKPILLAKLFTHWETKAPAEINPKREYLFKHCLRFATKNSWKFNPPPVHPFNPLYVLRLSCLNTFNKDIASQEKMIEILWKKIWEEGKNPDNPDLIAQWLTQENFAAQQLLENAFSKDTKDELKNNTDEAIRLGAFGVPTVVITNQQGEQELFWGNDAWPDIINYLQGKDVLDKNLFDHIVATTIKGATQKLNI